ncbi:HU domain-containing protein [Pontibacter sp. CAU 1760]
MVEKHIKTLLYDHDCVIIPDFGGLITRYVSAKINPVKHAFAPPSKKVAFNEKLVLNDGLLISTIAYHNNITREEAQQLVASFVHQARHSLNEHNRFELQGIGLFRYSPERRLEFEYVEEDNLLDASFGLPELTARPARVEEPAVLRTLIKERQQEHAAQKQPFKKRLKRAYNLAASLALVGLAGTALYFLSLQRDYDISSLNPVSFINATYTVSGTPTYSRYASDYVPFTADQRQESYAAILPVAPIEVEEASMDEPELLKEEIAVDSARVPLANAAELIVEQETITAPTKVAAVKKAEPVKEIEQPATTINDKTGRSYIIIGGYSTTQNAESRRDAVRQEGHQAKVLLPGPNSKLYRVSVADFNTPEEAKAALKNYSKSFGETIWVFNN